jgi:hypothetical protein
MRKSLLLAAFLAVVAAGCASAGQQNTPAADADQRVKSTSEANMDGITGAMTAPLRDVNVIRTKIPRVLLEAMDDPYRRPGLADCATLVA